MRQIMPVKRSWQSRIYPPILATAALYLISDLPRAGAQVFTIAREGQQATAEPIGMDYISFGFPVIGSDGTIAFGATIGTSPTTFPQTQVAYIGSIGRVNVLCQQGTQAKGAPAGVDFLTCNVSEVSTILHGTSLNTINGAGITSAAVFGGGPGTWTCFAYQGLTAPGTGGATYNGFFLSPSTNTSGQIAFAADLNGPLGGIFQVSGGAVSNVALSGLPAPGLSTPFFEFNTAPAIGNNGIVTFSATTGVSGNLGPSGIWSGLAGSLQLVAATGQNAPGTPSGVTFSTVSQVAPSTNHNGQLAFRGGLIHDGSVDSTNDSGIWSNIGGSLSLVARAGDQAPGFPAGTTFSGFAPSTNGIAPVLNDTGEIAFASALLENGNTTSAIFAGAPGALKPIIVQGQAIPDLPAGDLISNFQSLNLNDLGQMIFLASFTGPGVNAPFNTALISYDPDAGLNVVAMSGVTIPGVGSAPEDLSLVGDNAGYQPGSLADRGQFVFSGDFPDGFRIMESSIPEPATGLFLLPVIGLLIRRRRTCQKHAVS